MYIEKGSATVWCGQGETQGEWGCNIPKSFRNEDLQGQNQRSHGTTESISIQWCDKITWIKLLKMDCKNIVCVDIIIIMFWVMCLVCQCLRWQVNPGCMLVYNEGLTWQQMQPTSLQCCLLPKNISMHTYTHIYIFTYKKHCIVYSILGAFLYMYITTCHHICRLNEVITVGLCIRPIWLNFTTELQGNTDSGRAILSSSPQRKGPRYTPDYNVILFPGLWRNEWPQLLLGIN